jgi:hypothetical protein
MKRIYRLVTFIVIQAILLNYVLYQYIGLQDSFSIVDDTFIYSILTRPQKLFLNVTITYSLLLWANPADYLEPIIRTRYHKLSLYLLYVGVKLAAWYTIYTTFLLALSVIGMGGRFAGTIFPELLLIFVMTFQFYTVANILYILFDGNYVLALISMSLLYLIFSTVIISMDFIGIDTERIYKLLHSAAGQSCVNIALWGGLHVLHKKDCI